MRGHDRREAAMTRAMPAASVRKPASRGFDVVHHCLEFVRLEVANLSPLRCGAHCDARTALAGRRKTALASGRRLNVNLASRLFDGLATNGLRLAAYNRHLSKAVILTNEFFTHCSRLGVVGAPILGTHTSSSDLSTILITLQSDSLNSRSSNTTPPSRKRCSVPNHPNA